MRQGGLEGLDEGWGSCASGVPRRTSFVRLSSHMSARLTAALCLLLLPLLPGMYFYERATLWAKQQAARLRQQREQHKPLAAPAAAAADAPTVAAGSKA